MRNHTSLKLAGMAALLAAATYVIGFVLLLGVLLPVGFGSASPDVVKVAGFLAENTGLMKVWNLTIYVLNAVALGFLVMGWRSIMGESPLRDVSAAFGLIWAGLLLGAGMMANVTLDEVAYRFATDPEGAGALWRDLQLVEEGLGGGNEIAGGLWILLGSFAAGAGSGWPALLRWLGIVIGAAGLGTVLPGMSDPLGMVFGLGFILWFIWAGVVLIRAGRDLR